VLATRPLLLGHRGARRRAPENTLGAFDLCLAHGCDGFEFDVRRSADARSVLCHDSRLAGFDIAHTRCDLLSSRCQLTLGYSPAALEEVLSRFPQAFLDIELKVPGLEHLTVEAVRASPPQKGYVVSSFLPEVLKALHALDPEIPLGIIADSTRALARWRELPVAYVIPKYTVAGRELIEEAHGAGKHVLVWTVNRAPDMVRWANLGVDGIISDDTELLCRTLGSGRV
jgi:glycerophosphoryl diester phosphodiesterase